MTTAAQYKKHTHREHILELPDTYIGSVDTATESRWVINLDKGCMEWRAVRFCPGFLKIFDEILVNALDHRVRQAGRLAAGSDGFPVKHIDVSYTGTTITVRNDGDGIPVDKHPETGLWAPELIFGHLLTSSNYNKEEEKIVGGKNGYGSKCLLHSTPIPLWNGTVKPASEVVVGDQLIGDDGTPRNVLSILNGTGQMYKVNQAHAQSYVVNDAHTLTMTMPDHKVIFWNSFKNGWSILWWDHQRKAIGSKTIQVSKPEPYTCAECGTIITQNIQRHYRRLHKDVQFPTKERSPPHIQPPDMDVAKAARAEMEAFAATIDNNNVFDITIGDFMALNASTQKRLAGLRGKCVNWPHKDVVLDPYVLGLWLGDGMQHGYSYACYGEKDPEIITYLEEWGTKNDATIVKTNSPYTYRISSTSNKGKKGHSPLRKQLAVYNLINNKHIPADYLYNDRTTRLKVLAGLIDTDGHVSRNGTRIGISQSIVHKTLAEQIVYLARSLGFSASSRLYDVKYTTKAGIRQSQAYKINISGEHIGTIPTRIPRKKCVGTVARATDTTTGFLTVEDAGTDTYVGIHIDGNERFLINDFTVTHNCTNIFSSQFVLDTIDHRAKKRYTQTWTSNMSVVGKPVIKASSAKPMMEIVFTPDLSRFHWGTSTTPKEIPADMLALIATRVMDAAAMCSKDCKVSLNGKVVASNTFPKYIQLYLDDAGAGAGAGAGADSKSTGGDTASVAGSDAAGAVRPTKKVAYEVAGERWEIGAVLTRDLHTGDAAPDERHISFVNGIATRRGGKHLDYVSKTVLAAFCEAAKKKAKLDITPALLKDSVVWFINSTIVNPSFDTQTKETLTTPASKFGSTPTISPKFIDQLMKIGLLTEAQALFEAKNVRDAKRTDGKKKSSVRGIPKLEDAIWAGTAKSAECTLILTEGDSAATTAISGLKVVGREKYGVFPLKGKIMNVKDISVAKKTANVELTHIKHILGLETGKVYTDLKQLRYGRVMIMTDQDVDGSHIKGLLMNLFHTDWPSLLRLGFLCCLMTPLLKAFKGGRTLCFYSESEYEAWLAGLTGADAGGRGWKTKYYKGLGTSTALEAREYFANMNMVEYIWDTESDGTIDLAFNKKRADDRKDWLGSFDRKRHLNVGAGGGKVGYSRFVHDELIHFSSADNIRSLPHVMDGLKPSQRKIFWSALKRNLTSELRVAQLAGYVSETAAYHHGEASLNGAIIGMAQNFVGSNNINLLVPNGQFGTRLMGGDDSASPRYIHTQLGAIVRALVKKDDDAILTYLDDDGLAVEPDTYLPVIPLLLVNGCVGIGTGFSTNVIPYNPLDLVAALEGRLRGSVRDLTDTMLTPWWFGFKGRVYAGSDSKTWITKGLYEFVDDDAATIRITELPVGCWTKDYKAFLDSVLAEQDELKKKNGASADVWLRGYEEAYNDIDCDFILQMDPDYYHEARAYPADFEAKFKLTTQFRTSNMVAFDVDGTIRRFTSPGEILERFYGTRLAAYTKRKAHELRRLTEVITELSARLTFLRAVISGRLVISNVEDSVLYAGLKSLDLPPLSDMKSTDLKGYEYLLRLRVDRLKASAIAELEREVATEQETHRVLLATTEESLWMSDLATFRSSYDEYAKARTASYESTAASGKSGAVPAPKKRVVKPKVAKA
jgi:DNA topoisomerase II